MSSITTINGADVISTSRTDINTNFSNLNTDKIETSVLDTDTSLTANSDAKVATQKAVKAYIDSGGQQNASTTVRGLVEEATSAEMIAGTAAGGTGARLFINPTLVAETGTDKIVKTKSTGLLDTSILPFAGIFKNGDTTQGISDASTTQNIAHGLGVAPKYVRITGVGEASGGNTITYAQTTYNGTTQSSLFWTQAGSTATQEEAGALFRFFEDSESATNYKTGVVTFDATNIIITWTKTGTPANVTINLSWEAMA